MQLLRAAIIKAAREAGIMNANAREAGIMNANQFGEVIKSLGLSKSMAIDYYKGVHDYTGGKLDLILKHFGLKVQK